MIKMEKSEFIDLVKKHFGFLIEDYGFAIVYSEKLKSFGDLCVVLQSGDCRIRIATDRGVVELHAGLHYAPYEGFIDEFKLDSSKRWHNLYHVTRFLTQGSNQANWDYIFPEPGFDKKTRVERQIVRLTKILEPYWDKIIELFQETTFKKRRKELELFLEKLAEEELGMKKET